MRAGRRRAPGGVGRLIGAAPAQQPTPSPEAATPQAAATPAPAPAPSPTPAAPPTPAASGTPAPNPETGNPDKTAAGETVDLTAQPCAYLEAKANRDEVYYSIMGFARDGARRNRARRTSNRRGSRSRCFWRPTTSGFKYRAEIPVEAVPDGKTDFPTA